MRKHCHFKHYQPDKNTDGFRQVDIYYMAEPPGGDWLLLGTEVSDKSGRVTFTIPESKALGFGLYPIKMVVR